MAKHKRPDFTLKTRPRAERLRKSRPSLNHSCKPSVCFSRDFVIHDVQQVVVLLLSIGFFWLLKDDPAAFHKRQGRPSKYHQSRIVQGNIQLKSVNPSASVAQSQSNSRSDCHHSLTKASGVLHVFQTPFALFEPPDCCQLLPLTKAQTSFTGVRLLTKPSESL